MLLQVKHPIIRWRGKKPIELWMTSNLLKENNPNTLSVILAFAILANDAASTKLLIEKGADIHCPCYDEKSPYQLSFECDSDEVREIILDAYKAVQIGQLLGKPHLKPGSLIYRSAKAASEQVLEINCNTGVAFFKNIPKKLEAQFNDDYQKVIIAASKNADEIELECDPINLVKNS